MGYIKKLKNNELVGGTDKTTIYPVTSTEAVFEEVKKNNESNFVSQKHLNNHITGDRIDPETITDDNIAVGTITKRKLSPQVQTMLDEGQKKALTPKGNYNSETEYEALDLVFDPVTNSSYISLQTPNVGHPVDENAEGYEEGWWEKTLDGTAVNAAQAAINNKVDQLNTQVNNAIGQANQDIQDLIDASQETLQAAIDEANDAAGEARDAASTVETLTSQQVADAQIGYFTCTNTAASGAADNETKITTTDTIGESHYVKTVGSHVKVKMAAANTHAAPVYLQFGSNNATRAQVYYNGIAVDASNSWDNNETISVYYDGTNYQASNAQGGSNRKIDAYLYGDLKTLALGQTYTLGEPVKTDDKQLLYMLKTVSEMNVTDEVNINSFKAIKSGTYLGTYQSLKSIKAYTDITYTDGNYAIGSPAGAVIQVTVDSETIAELEESTTISVTIAGIELSVDIDSTMDAIAVATAIYNAFGTKAEWKLINNNDGTLTLISKVAKTTAPTISSNTGSTGITIAFSEDSAYAGTNVLSKYSEGNWNTVTLNEFASDSSEVLDTTKVWLKLSFNALKVKLTKQDSVAYEASNTPKNITGGNSDLSICDENGNILVNFKKGEVETKEFNSKYTSIVRNSNSFPSLKICDDKGNVLVIFDNGHIKTKKFDSADIVGNTTLKGKTFSVLGDSISTFSGYIGTSNPFYPNNDVNSDGKTWWGKLKADSGLIDYRINAIGACTISRHLTSQVPISDSSRFTQLLSEGDSGNVPNFIIVFGGINDWNSGAALGSYTDDFSSPTTTFIPSVRYLMKQLQLTYPASTIFFCTPVRSWYGSLSTYYPPTKGGRSLEDYVNAIIKCGSLHGVPIIDLYNNLNINEGNMTNMLIDKLHPKYAGNIAIATYIRHELEKYV